MNIDKTKILEMLKDRGDHDKAAKAESELPDQVDTDKDKGKLDKLGIDPSDLMGGMGDMGDKVGL